LTGQSHRPLQLDHKKSTFDAYQFEANAVESSPVSKKTSENLNLLPRDSDLSSTNLRRQYLHLIESQNRSKDIKVSYAEYSTTGCFSKANYCYYCGNKDQKLLRHLKRKHHEETDVKILSELNSKSEAWKKTMALMRNKGNFKHNSSVIAKGLGELVVVRRPEKEAEVDYSNYVPCADCLGFYSQYDLRRHILEGCIALKATSYDERKSQLKNKRQNSKVLLVTSAGTHSPEMALLFSKCSRDEISDIIFNDQSILLFSSISLTNLMTRKEMNLMLEGN